MKLIVLIDDSLGELNILNQYVNDNNINLLEIKKAFSLKDYQNFAYKIANNTEYKGIIFTTNGIDTFLVANKIKKIRAAFIIDELTAKLCIEHNNANIIIFPLHIISLNYSIKLMDIVLNSNFEGSRHSHRVNMLDNLS